jgi:hypothetical protein
MVNKEEVAVTVTVLSWAETVYGSGVIIVVDVPVFVTTQMPVPVRFAVVEQHARSRMTDTTLIGIAAGGALVLAVLAGAIVFVARRRRHDEGLSIDSEFSAELAAPPPGFNATTFQFRSRQNEEGDYSYSYSYSVDYSVSDTEPDSGGVPPETLFQLDDLHDDGINLSPEDELELSDEASL